MKTSGQLLKCILLGGLLLTALPAFSNIEDDKEFVDKLFASPEEKTTENKISSPKEKINKDNTPVSPEHKEHETVKNSPVVKDDSPSTLPVLPAFSSKETDLTVKNSNSSPVTVSFYTGTRGANLGNNIRCLGEIGLELMHGNLSTSFGFASGWYDGLCACGSAGFKLYSAGVDSKDKIFCGLDYMGGYNWNDNAVHTLAVTSGYRHTYSNGYFISPYIGTEFSNDEPGGSLRFGINTGYEFGMNTGYQFMKEVNKVKSKREPLDLDPNKHAGSLYSKIGVAGADGDRFIEVGAGVERMYKNISFGMGVGCGYENNVYISEGLKVYNSGVKNKDRFFVGCDANIYTSYHHEGSNIAVIGGYRYTAPTGIFVSPYIGRCYDHSTTYPYYGINVGYQFKPIHPKKS